MNVSRNHPASIPSQSTPVAVQGPGANADSARAGVQPELRDGDLVEIDPSKPASAQASRGSASSRLFKLMPKAGHAPDTTLTQLPPRATVDTTDGLLTWLPSETPLLHQLVDPDAARKRIEKRMAGYDPQSSDADQIAEEIAESPELLVELTRAERELLIRGLFDGPTSESEEDAAVKILLHGTSQADLQYLVQAIGWDELVDELDSHDLQQINQALGA